MVQTCFFLFLYVPEKIITYMEDIKSKAESLTHHFSDLIDTYYKLALVTVTQKATNITSSIMAAVTTLILLMLTLVFLGIGLALVLGNALDSRAAGFFIVAGLFIIIMVLLVVLRKKLVFPILKKAILKKLYE